MKVLHLLDELRPSGAEVMLRDSGALWRRHGVAAEILSTGAARGDFAAELERAGYPVHHRPNDKRPGFFLDLFRLLRARRFRLVHQHTERTGFWLSAVCLLAGCKVVRVVHNNFAFTGALRWRRTMQRRLLRSLGVEFVAISAGVQRNEQACFGLPTRLVWNWADVDRFRSPTAEQRRAARAAWGFKADQFVLVSVGNCSTVKNHGALIRALAACRDLPRLRYLHVGSGEDTLHEQALATRLGLGADVVFAGRLDDSISALRAADLFVMPSLHEGFSIAAIESFAMGLPALLADVPGLRDVDQFFPNVFFSTTEPEDIARKLREVLQIAPETLHGLTRDYAAVARQRFAPERGVADYVALYAQAV